MELYHSDNKYCGSPCFKEDWRSLKIIGEGAYGQVLRACCHKDCNYAIKKIENLNIKLFEDEVNFLIKTSNIGISPCIYDAWIEDGIGYIVMDKLNMTLYDYLKIYHELTKREVNNLITLINIMHNNNIYHRDLHQNNIMINPDGKFSIIDFGKSIVENPVSDIHQVDDFASMLSIPDMFDNNNKRYIISYLINRFPKYKKVIWDKI